MRQLLYKGQISELAKIKSGLRVSVSVQTRPNSEVLNSLLLGLISSSIGGFSNTADLGKVNPKLIMTYKIFSKVYSEVIIPSISDIGSIQETVFNKKFFVIYGNCNNIARVFLMLQEIPVVELTNISILVEVFSIKKNNNFIAEMQTIKEEII